MQAVAAPPAASLDEQFTEAFNLAVDPYTGTGKERIERVKALLKKGARPNADQAKLAVYYKNPKLVELLINKKYANDLPLGQLLISSLTIYKDTVTEEQFQIVRHLLSVGANVNELDRMHYPLDLAANSRLLNSKQRNELARILLNAGADVNLVPPMSGRTVLMGHSAGDLETLTLLIKAKADPFAISEDGYTPLHFVCARADSLRGSPDPDAAKRIALLLKSKESLNVHAPNQVASLPLFENMTSHNPDCIRALLEAGASVDAQAFGEAYLKHDPSMQGATVRNSIEAWAKKYPDLYNDELVKLIVNAPKLN